MRHHSKQVVNPPCTLELHDQTQSSLQLANFYEEILIPGVLLEVYQHTASIIELLEQNMLVSNSQNTFGFTSTTLSTEIISFSVSVKVVKKPFNSDTKGAAYDSARPTCSEFLYP
jgi:hypothetical protein